MDLLGIEHLLPKEEKEISGWLWMRGKLTGAFDDGPGQTRCRFTASTEELTGTFGDGQMQSETTVSTHELTVSTDELTVSAYELPIRTDVLTVSTG